MITASQIFERNNVGGGYGERETFYKVKDFAIPSINTGTSSDTIRFLLGENTSLTYIKIYCLSEKYDLTLYDEKNCNGFGKIPSIPDINKYSSLSFLDGENFGIVINRDQPQEPYVYAIINNEI